MKAGGPLLAVTEGWAQTGSRTWTRQSCGPPDTPKYTGKEGSLSKASVTVYLHGQINCI